MLSPVGGMQEQVGPLGGQRALRLPSPLAGNDQENRRPGGTSTGGLQVRQNELTMGASQAQLQPALRREVQIVFVQHEGGQADRAPASSGHAGVEA